jgi:hypothetical protein
MQKQPVNEFYDVSRLPEQPGILAFFISPSLTQSQQNPDNTFQRMKYFTFAGEEKISEPEVGMNLIYGDTLYFHEDETEPIELRNRMIGEIDKHKHGFKKILDNNPEFIKKAFNFTTWNQLLLSSSSSFTDYFGKIKQIYNKDEEFQKYIKKDFEEIAKRDQLDELQLNFFLEEILVFYLTAKGQMKLQNDFVQRRQNWILNCYPRKPIWSQIYLHQLNPFDLSWKENRFENSYYDTNNKILYDFDRVDIKTLDFSKAQN